MTIKSKKVEITKQTIHYMEYDNTDYRRIASNVWEERMGESWESVYIREKELEKVFQANL